MAIVDNTPPAENTRNRLSERIHKLFPVQFWGAAELVDLLLPPACRLCNEPIAGGQEFCSPCDRALTLSEPLMVSACQRCGRPGAIGTPRVDPIEVPASDFAANNPADNRDDPIAPCVQCKREKFVFDQVVARWTYQGRVCDAIVAAKYARQAALGDSLGKRLGQRVLAAVAADLPDKVTFVPSHPIRQFTRGGNGIVTIAQAVARQIAGSASSGLPGSKPPIRVETLLRTTRKIKKQAWLTDDERRKNVCGAFAAKKSYAWPRSPGIRSSRITDQHILLIDDVLTTGATANEVAQVLKTNGARRVTLAVVARAVWSG